MQMLRRNLAFLSQAPGRRRPSYQVSLAAAFKVCSDFFASK